MKNILTAFAAVMISLLMLCGCSEDDVGELEETYVGTDISRYIDSIDEEPTETLSETVSEDDTETSYGETSDGETSDGEMSDGEKSNDEISDSETAAETVISDEITSADIPEASEDDLSETEKAFQKYYFRSEKLFDSHYEKHGAEFGDITQDEYLDLANELINAEGENILHKTEKEDGDFLYYDTETNEFLVLSTDGYIRTFFKPSAGLDYWERQ
ncbi:MAG: hypothetical protein MRZ39_05930 [Oscillospiraceae bacterium]|nr:hypothetical protein [Oscillospiraceae bacterium]